MTSVSSSEPFARFVGFLERLDREQPDLLRVLTYHRIQAHDANPRPSPGLTVPPRVFAEQMRFVREHYHVVSAQHVVHALRARESLPPRTVLLTFDDGYRDFLEVAWPVLKALELPVALFVPTAFPGEPGGVFWWDRLYHALMNTARPELLESPVGRLPLGEPRQREEAYLRLRNYMKKVPHAEAMSDVAMICTELAVAPPPRAVLGWDELRKLAADGVTIGSHTRTHPILTQISPHEARAELAGSRRDLERELGSAPSIFAYPSGAFNDGVVRLLADEGYQLGFTTVRGINEIPRAHPLKLRRIGIGRRTSLALMRAQLAGRSVGLNRFYPLDGLRPLADDWALPGEASVAG